MQFYTLVSLRTCEEDFARHRQLFLTGQGYSEDCEGVIFQHAAVQRSLSMIVRVDSRASKSLPGLPGVLAVVAPCRVLICAEATGMQEWGELPLGDLAVAPVDSAVDEQRYSTCA